MGLLGDSFDDPKASAIMALSGGLLRGDFGGGLLGANQAFADSRQNAMKQKFMDMQMQNYASEIEQRSAAIAKQKQLQEMTQRLLGGGPSPAAPGQMGSGSFGIVPPPAGMTDMPQPRPAGLAGASVDQIAALHAAGGPDLLNAYKAANEGFERKPGTFYDIPGKGREYVADPTKGFGYDVRTGTVSPMRGFPETNALIKGAETSATEGAKAQFAPLPLDYVDAGTGRPMGGSVGDYLNKRPMQNQSGGSISPDLSEFIRQDAARNGIANPVANFTGAPQGGGYGLGAAGFAAPGGLQSKAEGEAASAAAKLPFDTAGKVNETWLKTSYEPVVVAGNAANDILGNVQVARQSMRNMGGSGWGTEAKAVGASVLQGLGIASDNAKLFAANAETFQNAAMSNLQRVLNSASGPQTEGDADRAGKTFAQLKNTPQANEFILDMTEAKATRDAMKARFFQQALPIARQKGDLQEVEREWMKRSPSIFSMPSMQRWAGGVK